MTSNFLNSLELSQRWNKTLMFSSRQMNWNGVLVEQCQSPASAFEMELPALSDHWLYLHQVQRIYLDELGEPNQQPVGINLMQLTIASEQEMAEQARRLIERVQLEETETLPKNEIIDIITTIAVYKFASLSREEVEAMIGLTLEQTRVYQEAKAEGHVEGRVEREGEMLRVTVPLLLKMGMSAEQIAQDLKVELEAVRLAAQ